jgi:hypothetical protein
LRAEPLLAAAIAAALALPAAPASAEEIRPLEVRLPSQLPGAALPAVLRREVRAFGPSAPPMTEPPVQPDGRPSLVTEQSIGCLLMGTTVSGLTLLAGAENLVNVVGGGLVRAANPRVLTLGVAAVTFGTFCAVGGALTPLYLHLTREPPPAAPAQEPPTGPLATPLSPGQRG